MAAASLLTLLDDIATVLDDVALMTKLATRKTAGVIGDDLALNAEQVSGVRPERELPVVWAVAKGSLLNKAILVPAALLISAIAPWMVIVLLMLGGAYLCYEGAEKLLHRWRHRGEVAARRAEVRRALVDPNVDMVAFERDRIRGAIRTDFVLSAEIIVITLGTVAAQPFVTRVAVLVLMALLVTVAIYGLVASIVKLDDVGLHLSRKDGATMWTRLQRRTGLLLLSFAPWLMKGLAIVGTAAMFLVGGGILVHGVPVLHHAIEQLADGSGALAPLVSMLGGALVGIVAGAIVVAGVALVAHVRRAVGGGPERPAPG